MKVSKSSFVPAAQYLRASTEHQQYSIENQKLAMSEFAALHGFEIIRTYEDAAKSGLTIANRAGLKALIQDVVSESASFTTILVYDVSRWGRFQDADEAAYYEFLCRHSGVSVEYCAEPFKNDGTLPSSILKAIKRTMASEYSRELGMKVFAGQSRLAELGYHVGGAPRYGLRRLLVAPDGTPKQVLQPGEEKSIATDRIKLIPGPKNETQTVQRIYGLALRGRLPARIALLLNNEQVPYVGNKRWRGYVINNMLKNPKYAGDNCWARTARKLKGTRRRQSQETWVCKRNAFQAVVSRTQFERVQTKIREWNVTPSNAELISKLRNVAWRKGKMSAQIIDEEHKKGRLASRQMYHCRFGTMAHMYELIHYEPRRGVMDIAKHRVDTQRITAALVDELKSRFPAHIELMHLPGKFRKLLRVDDFFNVSVMVCSYSRRLPSLPRWLIKPLAHETKFITLLCRLHNDNATFLDFRLLPSLELVGLHKLKGSDYPFIAGEQIEIGDFYYSARRMFEREQKTWQNNH